MNRRRVGVRHKTTPAARFIHALAADRNAFFRFNSALDVMGWLSALHANRVGLGNVLSDREELRHRLPAFPGAVLIQTRDNYRDATLREFVKDRNELIVEKLGLVG